MFCRPDIHLRETSQGQKVMLSFHSVRVLEEEKKFLWASSLSEKGNATVCVGLNTMHVSQNS